MFESGSSADQSVRPMHLPHALGTCDAVISMICAEKRVSHRLLTHPSRCRAATARARQLAMYLCHVVLGRSLADIGAVFGRDRTTVSHACAVIEDMRDDPAFDEEVSGYERRLEAQRDAMAGHAH